MSGQAEVQPEQIYRKFIDDLARKLPKFKPLDIFLKLGTADQTVRISSFSFSEDNLPSDPRTIDASSLANELKKETAHQLLIIEDVSPGVVAILGGYWKVDPQFFLDFLDSTTSDASLDSKSVSDALSPIPWFRLANVEDHLPPLPSTTHNAEHVNLQFIGSREYNPEEPSKDPIALPDRLESHTKNGITRVAGGCNPIPREGSRFNPLAFIRQTAAAWFGGGDSHGIWRYGIILLDPPFHDAKVNSRRQFSRYRSFISHPLPPTVEVKDVVPRASCQSSLIHCLRYNANVQIKGVPSPMILLQDLCRVIASEWFTVNTYLERDINTIDWRLEQESALSPETFENFLQKLYTMRRRITKYQMLVTNLLESIRTHDRNLVHIKRTNSHHQLNNEVLLDIEKDFAKVLEQMSNNASRISTSVSLITSLMAVQSSFYSLRLNERLGFLTGLATFILPLNIVAAILAIQGDYGPEGTKFWVFWISAVLACIAIFAVFIVYHWILPVKFSSGAKRAHHT